jgi:hypothetical protein
MKRALSATIVAIMLAVSAAFAFGIRGSVVANGGLSSTPASNSTYGLYGTAGQPGIGIGQSATRRVSLGFWSFGGPRVVAVEPGGPTSPLKFSLGPAFPNPTRNETRFELALPRAARVRLIVFDVSGRQVGDEVRRLEAGTHSLLWRAPSARTGVYFVHLVTDGGLEAKRTIVVVR